MGVLLSFKISIGIRARFSDEIFVSRYTIFWYLILQLIISQREKFNVLECGGGSVRRALNIRTEG